MSTIPHKPERLLPLPLWIAMVLVVIVGVILICSKTFSDSSLYSAISQADAGIMSVDSEDGTQDNFGIVRGRRHQERVEELMSACDNNPALAKKVIHRALSEGNKSAKLIAIHAAFFLAAHGDLEGADFQKIAASMDPAFEPDVEIRKAAQRQISNLTLLKNIQAKAKYEQLPSNLPGADAKKGATSEVVTQEEGPQVARILRVRWSDPEVAAAWWKIHAGSGVWDQKAGAFVIP